MANADKCFLNIPFKQYLSSLTVDDEGKLDPESLKLAAGREFENYKAIERRVNDTGCGGANGCCSWVQARGTSTTLNLVASSLASFEVVYTTIDFQSGGWTINGTGSLISPFPNRMHSIDLSANFSNDATAGVTMVTSGISSDLVFSEDQRYLPQSVQMGIPHHGYIALRGGVTTYFNVYTPAPVTRAVSVSGIYTWMFSTCCEAPPY